MSRMESRRYSVFSVLRDLTMVLSVAAVLVLLLSGVTTVAVTFAVTSIAAFVLVRLVYRREARWLRHHAAGVDAYGRGDTENAEYHFRQSADYARGFPPTDNRLGQALTNLGAICESREQFDEAASLYTEALAIYERSSGPGVNRAASVRAGLERVAELAGRRNAERGTASAARSRTETVIETAARMPEVQRALHQLAELQDQLLYPDPSTYTELTARSFELSASIVAACGLANDSSEEMAKVADWVMESAVELNYYACGRHKATDQVRGAAAGCSTSIGSVFLSWTIKSPRERAAMEGVKLVLDYFNVSYFDYTKCRADESQEESAAISERLQAAISRADFSVELMSAEFGGTEWIVYERNLLRTSSALIRIVLCLDAGGAQSIRAPDEHRTVRIDASDGRPMVSSFEAPRWMKAASDDRYFRTTAYLRKVFALGKALRACYEADDFPSLSSRLANASPNACDFRAFAAWIKR